MHCFSLSEKYFSELGVVFDKVKQPLSEWFGYK